GEGLIGLSWALFVAGSPVTVVSQWKVESASTTELMLDFHRHLQVRFSRQRGAGGMTKAEALRLAALRLIRSERYAHPFYWAGFVMVGDGN
ncbi:MAG TPA: CHAT domain-containing protein, partial [Pyrinomonadaceae bacterium]